MSMTSIMDGIDTAIGTTLAPNHYAWPVDSVTVPCTVVGYPTRIEFDMAMARGGDLFVVPVWYLAGKSNTKDARDAVSAVLNDSSSVVSLLDGAHTWGDARVTGAQVEEVTINAVAYLGARFDCEVYG